MSGLLLQAFDRLAQAPGGVARLQELILSLAVRGKLVPQDPSDEPASVLVRRIRSYRDEQVKQGNARRERPFTPQADADLPFELPAGWGWIRFDDLIEPAKPISYGVLVPGPDVDRGVPFVRIADLSLTDPPAKPEKSISTQVDAQYQRTRLEGGEILMGVVGSIGKLGVAPLTWAGANIARAICRIVPVSFVNKDFVLLLLQSAFMRASFAVDTRTLAQPTLNVSLIRSSATPLPPAAEQSRIVTRVDELMRLCDALEVKGRLEAEQHTRLLDTLLGTLTDSATPEELAANWQRVAEHFDLLLDRPEAVDALEQTVLQLAVRGLLVTRVASDESARVLLDRIAAQRDRQPAKSPLGLAVLDPDAAPYELPSHWEWARLGDLVENMGSGWSPACDDGERTDPTRWAVLRTTAVQVMEFCAREHKAIPLKLAPRPEIEVQSGDILVTRAGPMNRVGISCWVDQTPSRLMLSDKIVRFHPVTDELAPAFVVLALNAGWTRELLEAAKTGMAASQVNVSQADLKSLWVPVCGLEEQTRIVARVTELRRLCADLRQRLATSQATQSRLAEALVESAAE